MKISPLKIHQITNPMTFSDSLFNSAFKTVLGSWIWWNIKGVMNDWKSLSQIQKTQENIFFKQWNASLHTKNLMQMKNKYVHVKAEVLRISKLVYFLRIDQIWSHYQAKQKYGENWISVLNFSKGWKNERNSLYFNL